MNTGVEYECVTLLIPAVVHYLEPVQSI